jgi:hypothetical protein
MARGNKFIKDYVAKDLFTPKYKLKSVPNKKRAVKMKGYEDVDTRRCEYSDGQSDRRAEKDYLEG